MSEIRPPADAASVSANGFARETLPQLIDRIIQTALAKGR